MSHLPFTDTELATLVKLSDEAVDDYVWRGQHTYAEIQAVTGIAQRVATEIRERANRADQASYATTVYATTSTPVRAAGLTPFNDWADQAVAKLARTDHQAAMRERGYRDGDAVARNLLGDDDSAETYATKLANTSADAIARRDQATDPEEAAYWAGYAVGVAF